MHIHVAETEHVMLFYLNFGCFKVKVVCVCGSKTESEDDPGDWTEVVLQKEQKSCELCCLKGKEDGYRRLMRERNEWYECMWCRDLWGNYIYNEVQLCIFGV